MNLSTSVEALGRRVGVPVLAGVLVTSALGVATGLLLTGPLEASLGELDVRATRSLTEARTPALDRLTGWATVLTEVVPVGVLWAVAVVAARWRTRRPALPVLLLAAVGGEKLAYLVTATVVDRPRPPVDPLGHVYPTGSG